MREVADGAALAFFTSMAQTIFAISYFWKRSTDVPTGASPGHGAPTWACGQVLGFSTRKAARGWRGAARPLAPPFRVALLTEKREGPHLEAHRSLSLWGKRGTAAHLDCPKTPHQAPKLFRTPHSPAFPTRGPPRPCPSADACRPPDAIVETREICNSFPKRSCLYLLSSSASLLRLRFPFLCSQLPCVLTTRSRLPYPATAKGPLQALDAHAHSLG